jgi:hypothetical protein
LVVAALPVATAQAPLRTIGFITGFDVKDDAVGAVPDPCGSKLPHTFFGSPSAIFKI